jgi:hypothetical protein
MMNDRTEQLERLSTTHPHVSVRRRVLRRRPVAAAPAAIPAPAPDVREGVAAAFRAFAHGVEPKPAHAQAAAFYRSGGQDWARSLGEDDDAVSREGVASAFRAMAHGIVPDAAANAMVRFYRSSGHGWARGLSHA